LPFFKSFNKTILSLADDEKNAIKLSNIFEDIVRTQYVKNLNEIKLATK
jgi:hypothetical protein